MLLELGVNDITKFQVVLLTDDVYEGTLAGLALFGHKNGLFDLLALMDLQDLEPIEKGFGQFFAEVLE